MKVTKAEFIDRLQGRLPMPNPDELERLVAQTAECVIGLGVDPVPGCDLCNRPIPCPEHVGAEIARSVRAVLDGAA